MQTITRANIPKVTIFNFSDYTCEPCSLAKAIDFRENYLKKWIENKQEVVIRVDNMTIPFSYLFVENSFCELIRKDKENFYKYITISNKTRDEKDLLRAITDNLMIVDIKEHRLEKTIDKQELLISKVLIPILFTLLGILCGLIAYNAMELIK